MMLYIQLSKVTLSCYFFLLCKTFSVFVLTVHTNGWIPSHSLTLIVVLLMCLQHKVLLVVVLLLDDHLAGLESATL